MKEKINSKLVKTNWGLRLDSLERNGRMVSLEHNDSYANYDSKNGTVYSCEIFYHASYASTPNQGNKNWINIYGDTIENVCNNPDFKKFNLKKEDVFPWCRIVR